jgi:hypothetical protein
MFNDSPDAKWYREFDELGVERVRGTALSTAWDRDKRQAARRWLEKQDTRAWQESRKGIPADKLSWKQRMKGSRFWMYAGAAVLLAFGALRLFRMF